MTSDGLGLTGKTAIVTGAARGIGLAAAARLASEGVDILAFDRAGADFSEVLALQDATGRTITPFEGDVTNEADWDNAVARCIDAHGRVDILFNNAGISGPTRTVLDFRTDDFDKVIAINVRGVFLGLRAAGRQMKEAGGSARKFLHC